MKVDTAKWCSLVGKKLLNSQMSMTLSLQEHSVRNTTSNNITDYRLCIAVPYIEELLSNIYNRFSEVSVQLLTSAAIFHPASIPKEEPNILEYGRTETQILVGFYGEQASVEFEGVTYTAQQKLSLMLKKQLLSGEYSREQ